MNKLMLRLDGTNAQFYLSGTVIENEDSEDWPVVFPPRGSGFGVAPGSTYVTDVRQEPNTTGSHPSG